MTAKRNVTSLFITLVLATGSARAGELPLQAAVAELQRQGDLVDAERVLQDAVKEARNAGPRSAEFAVALALLGIFYQDIGRFSQAESSLRASLKLSTGIMGPENPRLAPLITHLIWLYLETGRAGAARRLHPQSWVERLILSDPESKYLPTLLEAVGGLHALEGRLEGAIEVYRQDFDLLTRRGAHLSMEMASARNNIGFIRLKAGRYIGALDDFNNALQLWTQLSGPDSVQVAISRLGLAKTYMALGRHNESAGLLQQALPIFEQQCGPNSLRTEDVLTLYAQVLRHQKRTREAKKLEERAQMIRKASVADSSFRQVVAVWDLDSLRK